VRGGHAVELGLGVALALDLLQQLPRPVVARLLLEHRLQLAHGVLGLVALVVEPGQQQADLEVGLAADHPLQRIQGLVGPAVVDGGDAEPLEQRRVVGGRLQSLLEEQRRFVGPTAAQRLPGPPLEAAGDVLAPRPARRIVIGGAAELLAGQRELPAGKETDRLFPEGRRLGGGHHRAGGRRLGSRTVSRRPEPAGQQQRGDQTEGGVQESRPASGPRHPVGSIRTSGWPYSTG
jgi:hypothetical protein